MPRTGCLFNGTRAVPAAVLKRCRHATHTLAVTCGASGEIGNYTLSLTNILVTVSARPSAAVALTEATRGMQARSQCAPVPCLINK